MIVGGSRRCLFSLQTTSGCVRSRCGFSPTISMVALRSMDWMSIGRIIASWKRCWGRESIWSGQLRTAGIVPISLLSKLHGRVLENF